MNYYLMSVSYDGLNFFGFCKQNNTKLRTVEFEIIKAIKKIFKNNFFKIKGLSRTDRGVHALDQKIFLESVIEIKSLKSFFSTLNQILNPDIVINNLKKLKSRNEFFNYKQKLYCYNLMNIKYKNAFNNRYYYFLDFKFSFQNKLKLQKIANLMVGTHNFYHFITITNPIQKKIVRNIRKIKIKRKKSCYIINIYAVSFLHHQIRFLVGAILACFFKKTSVLELKQLLNEPLQKSLLKKQKRFFLVPGKGLILKKIFY